MIKRAQWAVLLGLVSIAAACGGGGGGGDKVVGGPTSNLSANFVGDQLSPAANQITLAQQTAFSDVVTVAVWVTDISNVYGAAFDLVYNPSLVRYEGWEPGVLLEQGGYSPNYTVEVPQAGRVVVGVSRMGNVRGANAVGTRTLIRLVFRATAVGSSPVAFQAASLIDDGFPPEEILGTSWFGGTLNATQ